MQPSNDKIGMPRMLFMLEMDMIMMAIVSE